MGQEIFYCSGCQSQLRSSDFEKGKAYKLLGLDAICSGCAPQALQALPPEKLQALRRAMGGPPSSTPKRGTERIPMATSPPRSGTGRIPLAGAPSSTRRTPVAEQQKSLRPVLLFAVVAAAALLVALVAFGGRKPAEPAPRPHPTVSPPDAPSAAESGRDRATKESLRKAQLFVDAHPKEYLEQIRLFEQAAAEAKGTPFEADVAKALEKTKRRVQEAALADLRMLDERALAASAKEEFKRAVAIYEEARKTPITPDWSGELDRRIQDVHAKMDSAFGRIRTQALVARPGSDEVKALRERIATWGNERLLADLDKALADAAAPKPAPAPSPTPAPPPPDPPAAEGEAFARTWTACLTLAYGRDFSAAVQELERVAPTLRDPTLRSQAAADLEILRGVGSLHADAMQALAKMPAGRKVAVSFVDFDNNLHRVEGPLSRVRNGTIEIAKGRPIPQWPLGHITPRSLADFAPGRNKATAAIACLIEGDAAGAKELAGEGHPAVPARYWKWSAEIPQLFDEEIRKKEGNARYEYYFAVLNQGAPTLRAEAALKCRRLMEESGSLPWVRRNRAMLAAVADATREYVAGPATLRPAGMFRLEVPRTLPYWMSSIDVDPAKRRDNYVEMDFSVLADATYRAWAYVGACCSESLVFHAQTTDLAGAEPGSEPEAPVKHAMTSAIRNHSGHAGRKGPSRWGWVELPLPKYEKPGPKVLRLLSGSQGFSVAWVVVSSLRDKPPADVESKDWERDLLHSAGPAGPTIGLAAWFKADAGTVVEGGKVAQWQDQSGHGRHALQVQPAARPAFAPGVSGGKPAIRFDGASNVLTFDCPVNGRTGMTIFMFAAASKNLRGDLGNHAALQWPEFAPWGNVFVGPQQTCVAWRYGSGEFGNVNLWERPGGQSSIVLTTVRKDGPKEELFVQGVPVATPPKPRYPVIAHTLDTATIGAGNDGRGNALKFYPGDISEILIFTRAVSEAERDAIERYLRGKYGI